MNRADAEKIGQVVIENGQMKRPAPKHVGGWYFHGTRDIEAACRYVGATQRETRAILRWWNLTQ